MKILFSFLVFTILVFAQQSFADCKTDLEIIYKTGVVVGQSGAIASTLEAVVEKIGSEELSEIIGLDVDKEIDKNNDILVKSESYANELRVAFKKKCLK